MALERHTFTSIDEIFINNLKFCSIIPQAATYTAQVITKYLKPLCSGNNYIFRNTQEFPAFSKQQNPLLTEEECVS